MIRLKNKSIYFTIIIICMMILGVSGYRKYEQQYKMAVIVPADNGDGSEWPSKRTWFDASEWLNTPQYIKINNTYLINARYIPVGNLNSFCITRRLQDAILDAIHRLPELSELTKMNDDDFFHFMENKISYEYLRTKFNAETFKPTDDYFLFFFTYKGHDYEVELLRKVTKDGFLFPPYDYHADRKGYWYSSHTLRYSYRDYIKGTPIPSE